MASLASDRDPVPKPTTKLLTASRGHSIPLAHPVGGVDVHVVVLQQVVHHVGLPRPRREEERRLLRAREIS